jgi:hypothetical protein
MPTHNQSLRTPIIHRNLPKIETPRASPGAAVEQKTIQKRGVLLTNQRKVENPGRRMKNVLPGFQTPKNPGVHNRENFPVATKTFLWPFQTNKNNNKNQKKKK